MNRREFIRQSACFGGMAFFGSVARAAAESCGRPELVIGVVSDTHVTRPGTEAPLEKILRYFKSRNVDAVMMTGDLTDHGILDEMIRVRQTWDRVFPGGLGLNGKPVRRLAVSGNHEFEGAKYYSIPKDPVLAEQTKAARADPLGNEKTVWEKAWDEPYERLKAWNLKGYTFVGAQFEGYGGAVKLDEYLKGIVLPKDRPFFYFEHMQPAGTCAYYKRKADFNGKHTRPVLNTYPNAVAMAGHTHDSLTCEQQIWQGEFLSVNCASAHFIECPSGHENSFAHPGTPAYKAAQMPITDMWGMKQAMVLNVYRDRLVYERREFCKGDGERVAADWVVPLNAAPVYDFASRARINRAGTFPAGARLTVGDWKMGRSRAKVDTEQLTISFPHATPPAGYRIFDYVVRALKADGTVKCRKLVYNPHVGLDLSREDAVVNCIFARAELGTEPIRFEVCARDSFENESAPLTGKPANG